MAIGTAAAILGSAAIGALSSRSAAKKQAGAAQSAADAQLQASREANALQQRIYEEGVARQQPYYQAGINALAQMQGQMGAMPPAFTGQVDLARDPGYAFRLNEGLKAMDRQAAARGGLISGGALKAAQRYGQDVASQEYGNAYNRSLTEYNAARARESEGYNRLAGLAGVGGTTAQQIGLAGQNFAGQYGQNLMAGGQAAAQGMMNAGSARGSAYIGGANALAGGLGQYLNYQQNQQLMNRLLPGGGGGGGAVVSTPYDYGVDAMYSDVRLKTNIVKIGTRSDGLNVYEFDYVWGGPRQVGLMAQEVLNVYPDAVAEVDGYLTVDYGKV
jgi:hypothetical protein